MDPETQHLYPYQPFQELMVGDAEGLHVAIEAAEVLMLGFEVRKESVLLKNESDQPAEYAIHFRMTLFRAPFVVPAEDVPR